MYTNRFALGLVTAALVAASCGSSSTSAQQASETTTTAAEDATDATSTDGDGPTATDGAETGAVTVSGEPLPPVEGGGIIDSPDVDPAIGTVVPAMSGTNFNGGEVLISADGRPKAIYFLAHWCSHCRAEVELIEALVAGGDQPTDIDLYAVSIAVRPDGENFPPSTWLANFPGTVMRDSAESEAATAGGVTGIPYVLYVDGDNRLLGRSIGGLTQTQIVDQWNSLLPQNS